MERDLFDDAAHGHPGPSMAPPYSLRVDDPGTPLLAVALHHGASLHPEVAANITLDLEERRREEDPFSGVWASAYPNRVIVHRSRFEVDLNRPCEGAVYVAPSDAWGLSLWRTPPSPVLLRRARAMHAGFYATIRAVMGDLLRRHERVLVLDLHSYNHRRGGPLAPPADPALNPCLNVGTGSMDRAHWAPVVDAFVHATRRCRMEGHAVDVRENVRFRGGFFPTWIHRTYPSAACALALEVKKTFMDEWTGVADVGALWSWREVLRTGAEAALGALPATVPARASA